MAPVEYSIFDSASLPGCPFLCPNISKSSLAPAHVGDKMSCEQTINKIAIPYPQRAGPGVERGAGLERTPLSLDEELFLGHLELANNSKRNGDPRGL